MAPQTFSRDFSQKSFLVFNYLLKIFTSTQAMKLEFGRNKLGKRILCSLQIRIRLQKTSLDHVHEIIDELYLSKGILNVSFNFISCHEILKHSVCNNEKSRFAQVPMFYLKCICVSLFLLKLQSGFQTLLKKLQTVIRYMHTEFPRSNRSPYRRSLYETLKVHDQISEK